MRRRLPSATVVTQDAVTVLHLSRSAFENLDAEHQYFHDLVSEATLRKVG